MPKQTKLYTVKELSEELNVTDKRVYQLIDKWIYTDVNLRKLKTYVDYSQPRRRYKEKALSLLLSKQKQNSKFKRFHK